MEQLAKKVNSGTLQMSNDQVGLVKRTVFPDSTDDELKLFLHDCNRRGVDPLDKMIFPIKRKIGDTGTFKVTLQVSIDLMRSQAEATGEYDGQDEPVFEYADEGEKYPLKAKVSVYRKGMSRPVVGIANWSEFYPGETQGFMWRKMPEHMLAKCAEAQGLRKAFPIQIGGLYAREEMQFPIEGEILTNKVDSVKPVAAKATPKTAPKKAEKVTNVKATLKKELLEHCGGDQSKVKALLKEVSKFTSGDKERYISDVDHEKASVAWCSKALEKLRGMTSTAETTATTSEATTSEDPKGCTQDPHPCDHSSWSDDEGAYCVQLETSCKYA